MKQRERCALHIAVERGRRGRAFRRRSSVTFVEGFVVVLGFFDGGRSRSSVFFRFPVTPRKAAWLLVWWTFGEHFWWRETNTWFLPRRLCFAVFTNDAFFEFSPLICCTYFRQIRHEKGKTCRGSLWRGVCTGNQPLAQSQPPHNHCARHFTFWETWTIDWAKKPKQTLTLCPLPLINKTFQGGSVKWTVACTIKYTVHLTYARICFECLYVYV